jgi:hypothetical protein
MTADYSAEYQDALELVEENGTIGTMTWKSSVTTNNNTGVQSGGTTLVADVAIVVLPASARGDSYENQVQVRNTRRSFIAVPKLQETEIKNGYFITVGGTKYEVEAAAALAPSASVRILYQGMLRIAG